MIAFAGGLLDASRWRVLQNVGCLRSTTSSNVLVREIVELYFNEEQSLPATVLVAEEQREARGRNGKAWSAPAGKGLYLTLVRAAVEGELLSVTPIAVARWLRDAIEDSTHVAASLKWPNDLYVGRRKLAGVLSEARTQGEDTYVAVGIGLNVLGTAGAVGAAGATTLEEEAGRPFDLARVLQAVLDRIDRELAAPHWEREVALWEGKALHRAGDPMTVLKDGEEIKGEYIGLSPDGFLRLKTPAGEAVLAAGEVSRW
jgi:BirA family biotin operon repressor/biotin-[acetyl-CoA-carboxylase] ligase